MLAAGNFPQHRTVCEPTPTSGGVQRAVALVQVAREMGLALGKLSSTEGASEREQAQGDEL